VTRLLRLIYVLQHIYSITSLSRRYQADRLNAELQPGNEARPSHEERLRLDSR
jgi:hypothetical protein